MLRLLDVIGRRLIAWPLALLGLLLDWIATGLILLAAWIRGIDPHDDEAYL